MAGTRKIAAIMVADVVGYSRLIGADEEGTLARLGALRDELFLPTIEARGGRVANHAGDGVVVEFRSVVEAVRCALDITRGLADRNAPLPADRRIAWMLRRVEGLALAEVASACNCSLATAKRRIAGADAEMAGHVSFQGGTS